MQEKNSILIVDDDVEMCKTLSDILQMKGYQTFTANNGSSALENIKSQFFNIVIMDIKLPDIDGIKAPEALPGAAINNDIEVIIITAFASVESSVNAELQKIRGWN